MFKILCSLSFAFCRYEKRREVDRRKDYPEERVNNQPQQTFNRPRAADHWQDPWQRYS